MEEAHQNDALQVNKLGNAHDSGIVDLVFKCKICAEGGRFREKDIPIQLSIYIYIYIYKFSGPCQVYEEWQNLIDRDQLMIII